MMDCEPKIVSITVDNVSEDVISCKQCFYHGVITDVPKDTFTPFVEILEEKKELDQELKDYVTVCLLINDTVLFLDLLANADDYTAHPLSMIGLANMVRAKLDNVFPTKKITYLPQCQEWFKKQEKYHVEHEESIRKLKAQIELFNLLHPH
jgi:hypothetical protein